MTIAWTDTTQPPRLPQTVLLALFVTGLVLSWQHLERVGAFPAPDAIRFVQPRATVTLAGPRGASNIPIQAWVERHHANRWVQIEVWTNGDRVQSSGWSIDGEDAARLQPTYRPLTATTLPTGRHTFRALVCTSVTEESECDRIRASAELTFHVCGGEDECL